MNYIEAIREIESLMSDSEYLEIYSGSSNEPMNIALEMAIEVLSEKSRLTEKNM